MRVGQRAASRRAPVLGCVLALGLALALAGCARAGGEAFQPTANRALRLEPGATVGQTFRPATDAVAGVDLLVATYEQPADPDGVLRLRLRDGPGGRELARSEIRGDALADGRWAQARFPEPVPAPEVAAVEVSWDGASPLGLWANGPPDDLGPADERRLLNDPYPGGELLRDSEPAAGDLAFRVVGGGLGAAPAHAVGLLRQPAGRMLRDQPGFAVGWLALVGAAVALGVAGMRRSRGYADSRPCPRSSAEPGARADTGVAPTTRTRPDDPDG